MFCFLSVAVKFVVCFITTSITQWWFVMVGESWCILALALTYCIIPGKAAVLSLAWPTYYTTFHKADRAEWLLKLDYVAWVISESQ